MGDESGQRSRFAARHPRLAHLAGVGASLGYFVAGGSYYGHLVAQRAAGDQSLLPLHGSNFVLGLGFLGVVDHALSAAFPRHRTAALWTTLGMFTAANLFYEVGPAFLGGASIPLPEGFRLLPGPIDLKDLAMGQLAALGYFHLSKRLEPRLGF